MDLLFLFSFSSLKTFLPKSWHWPKEPRKKVTERGDWRDLFGNSRVVDPNQHVHMNTSFTHCRQREVWSCNFVPQHRSVDPDRRHWCLQVVLLMPPALQSCCWWASRSKTISPCCLWSCGVKVTQKTPGRIEMQSPIFFLQFRCFILLTHLDG